jgi:hypothetical protein
MKRMHTLLTAAVILGGLATQARPGNLAPVNIAAIHQTLRKAPLTPVQVGDVRYTLVNGRYEACSSRKMARCQGNYIKCVKPAEQGWSVVIITPSGTRVMEGQSLDEEGNILHGTCAYYDANGRLRAQGRYVQGLKTGTWSRYDANGQRLSDKSYHGEDWDATQVRVGLATMAPTRDKAPLIADF